MRITFTSAGGRAGAAGFALATGALALDAAVAAVGVTAEPTGADVEVADAREHAEITGSATQTSGARLDHAKRTPIP
jgi:hypothetical protein